MRRRDMSANDVPINESDRRYFTPAAAWKIKFWVFLGGCASLKFRVCKKFRVGLTFVYRNWSQAFLAVEMNTRFPIFTLRLKFLICACLYLNSGYHATFTVLAGNQGGASDGYWQSYNCCNHLHKYQIEISSDSMERFVGRRLSRSRINQYHHLHL